MTSDDHCEPVVDFDGRAVSAAAVIDALAPHVTEARLARMRGVLEHRLASVALGIEDLHLSHNGHACLRTAEGSGLQDAVAVELRHAYPLDMPAGDSDAAPEAVDDLPNRRITTAAHRWISLHRVPTTEALTGWARARDMLIFGAGPRGERTLDTLPVDRPLMVLFGNERDGLRDETMAACDDVFRIPMYGFTESFNVSVSVGMTLAAHTARVRARLSSEGRTGDLPAARQTALLAEWLLADHRAFPAILRRKLGI